MLTLRAMVHLVAAMALVTLVPFRLWRGTLDGLAADGTALAGDGDRAARQYAAHVARAVSRLPMPVKCLPQAIALSRMLTRAGLAHGVVFAARPAGHARPGSALHAWVEREGVIIIGDLPGPWIRIPHR